MTRRLLRMLFGPVARATALLFAVAAAWALWWVWPEAPIHRCVHESADLQILTPPILAASDSWVITAVDRPGKPGAAMLRFDFASRRMTEVPVAGVTLNNFTTPASAQWTAYVGSKKSVRVIALPNGEPVLQTEGTHGEVYLHASPDGRWLLVHRYSLDDLEVWDIPARALRATFKIPLTVVRDVSFLEGDRALLARAAWDEKFLVVSEVHLTDSSSQRELWRCNPEVEPRRWNPLFFPSTRHLTVIGSGTPRLLNFDTAPPVELPWPLDVTTNDGAFMPAYRRAFIQPSVLEYAWPNGQDPTIRTIARIHDPRIRLMLPLTRDGQFVTAAFSDNSRSMPHWIQLFLNRITSANRFGTYGMALLDVDTGVEVRRLPRDAPAARPFVHVSGIWTRDIPPRDNAHAPTSVVFELWPLHTPGPTWWLWLLTTCAIGFVAWDVRRARRSSARARNEVKAHGTLL